MKKSEIVRNMIVAQNVTEVTDEFVKQVQEVTGFSRALAKVYVKENIVRVAKMAAKAAAVKQPETVAAPAVIEQAEVVVEPVAEVVAAPINNKNKRSRKAKQAEAAA